MISRKSKQYSIQNRLTMKNVYFEMISKYQKVVERGLELTARYK